MIAHSFCTTELSHRPYHSHNPHINIFMCISSFGGNTHNSASNTLSSCNYKCQSDPSWTVRSLEHDFFGLFSLHDRPPFWYRLQNLPHSCTEYINTLIYTFYPRGSRSNTSWDSWFYCMCKERRLEAPLSLLSLFAPFSVLFLSPFLLSGILIYDDWREYFSLPNSLWV